MRIIIIAAALIAASLPVCASETLAGPYGADVLRVIDGDTVEIRIHVWLGQDVTTHVRINGIDAPELHGRCPGERKAAEAARDHLARLLGDTPVRLTNIHRDKYGGRVDASILLPTGRDVAAAMLSAGHARPWPHPKGTPRCPPYAAAAP
jgi:micrococcal nuclease